MADAQLKLSRRALLGAACASPLLISAHPERALSPSKRGVEGHPGLDPGSTFSGTGEGQGRWMPDQVRHDEGRAVTIWDRALSRLAVAEAALAAAAYTKDENLYDSLGARHDIALRRLLRTPAPDAAALALKLDLALDERTLEYFGDLAGIKALKRDALRLS